MRIKDLFYQHMPELIEVTTATRKTLNAQLVKRFRNSDSDVETQAALLRDYAQWLETECASIISANDPVFWLSLDRRIPGWLLMKEATESEEVLQQESSALKTALFFKYGAEKMSPIEAYLDGTFGFDVTSNDILQLFGTLHTMFDEITNLQGIYRRLNKGATLIVRENGELTAEPNSETGELMRLYDSRRQEFSHTFSAIGFLSAFSGRQEFPSLEFRSHR